MITDINALRAMSAAQEATLSGWDGGEITVRLKRPSLYEMAAGGSIPNPLLHVADALFSGRGEALKRASLDETAKTLRLLAKAALVEPTWNELEKAGVTLNDQQINEIYAFIVGGAAQLEKFRRLLRGADRRDGADDELPRVEPHGH